MWAPPLMDHWTLQPIQWHCAMLTNRCTWWLSGFQGWRRKGRHWRRPCDTLTLPSLMRTTSFLPTTSIPWSASTMMVSLLQFSSSSSLATSWIVDATSTLVNPFFLMACRTMRITSPNIWKSQAALPPLWTRAQKKGDIPPRITHFMFYISQP